MLMSLVWHSVQMNTSQSTVMENVPVARLIGLHSLYPRLGSVYLLSFLQMKRGFLQEGFSPGVTFH